MRRWMCLAILLVSNAAALGAQGGRLEGRLDARTLAALRATLDRGRQDSIPVSALEDKALEGLAKRVPPERIVAAVEQLGSELREARSLLRSAQPRAGLPDGEIIATADARRRGVPTTEIVAFRARVPATTNLLVAFTVLGDLVQRGIPAAEARRVIEDLLRAKITPEQLAEIPGRVDVALRVGAPPMEAFRSALPVPVRAPIPQQPPRAPSQDPPTNPLRMTI